MITQLDKIELILLALYGFQILTLIVVTSGIDDLKKRIDELKQGKEGEDQNAK